MASNYKQLGTYIQQVNHRNTELEVELLLGVSIQKVLMPSIANTVGTNMKTYKIIKRNQFAYGPVTSRNGDKISAALLEEHDEAIVSQAYTVFEVIDDNELHPEYLMMWFRRPEFDRYARFKSHGSAREVFDWDELCETELPIPSIEKQREIAKEYNTVVNRIKLNEQLNQKLEETAQALYKHWFVDFEFPNEVGKPYKTSGGAMVYNADLDKDIPEGWEVMAMADISDIFDSLHKTPIYSKEGFPMVRVTDVKKGVLNLEQTLKVSKEVFTEFTNKYLPQKDDLILTRVGTYGVCSYVGTDAKFCLGQNTAIISPKVVSGSFLYAAMTSSSMLEQIEEGVTGSTQKTISLKLIRELLVCLPVEFQEYNWAFEGILALSQNRSSDNNVLVHLKNLLLSKMTKVEVEEVIYE